MRPRVHEVLRSTVHDVTRLHTNSPDYRYHQALLASVLKLTLEWELDFDQMQPSRTSTLREDDAVDSNFATPNDEPGHQISDDWRATVAQFPDD